MKFRRCRLGPDDSFRRPPAMSGTTLKAAERLMRRRRRQIRRQNRSIQRRRRKSLDERGMNGRIPNLASERGAVLIHTAIAALVVVGFGTFVVDYGVLWVARHQAQNAADAGAMAGAIARAYDDFKDPPASGGVSGPDATHVVGAHLGWGA